MRCDYAEAGVCRSCTRLSVAYPEQVATKAARAREALSPAAPGLGWLDPVTSAERGFRNKAKLVVGGSPSAPTLGILGPDGHGVDLRACALHEPAVAAAIPVVADAIAGWRLLPYDVPRRRGELKHVLLTGTPDGALMLRFVLRGTHQLARIREGLPRLRAALPGLAVVSVNLQPEHKAVLEGPTEIPLTASQTLRMPIGEVTLRLRPGSFFQTNTAVAHALYQQARAWADLVEPASILDLYCGAGGFALFTAGPGREVRGVELSTEAVEGARASAGELRARHPELGPVEFTAGDATAYALGSATADREPADHTAAGYLPDLVVVNPPRRGLDAALTDRLERSAVRHVVYSSCHLDTLARDLARMPSLRAREARVFDMFPQTDHLEVMVLLSRD